MAFLRFGVAQGEVWKKFTDPETKRPWLYREEREIKQNSAFFDFGFEETGEYFFEDVATEQGALPKALGVEVYFLDVAGWSQYFSDTGKRWWSGSEEI